MTTMNNYGKNYFNRHHSWLMIAILFVGILPACENKRAQQGTQLFRDKYYATIYKIDSVNNYYLVYAKRHDSLFKIVSKKDPLGGRRYIVVNGEYPLVLESIWNVPVMIGNVNVSPAMTPHVTGMGLDDSTVVYLERDSINDLHACLNMRGLSIFLPWVHKRGESDHYARPGFSIHSIDYDSLPTIDQK